ncbi:MAG: TM2 domain-containing protein [Polyangiaceae bacterium]
METSPQGVDRSAVNAQGGGWGPPPDGYGPPPGGGAPPPAGAPPGGWGPPPGAPPGGWGPPGGPPPGGFGPPQYGGPPPGGYGGPPPGMGMPPGAMVQGAPYGIHPQSGLPYSDKQKLVAGLLQIFLPFGVGRFYTGHTGLGVAQLLVTLITCGVGAIWPVVDGILMLIGNIPDAQGRPLRD